MQALRSAAQRLGCRSLATLAEAAAAASAARIGGPLLSLQACSVTPGAGLPWASAAAAAAAAVLRQQPVSLSQGSLAAAALAQPATAPLVAPQQGGLVRQLEQLWADSVRRKRKRAMNKHKHRKRRKLQRMSSRK